MSTNPLLWSCADCGQSLPRPWSPCDCPNPSGDRYLVTPLGTIPAQQIGVLKPEQQDAAA